MRRLEVLSIALVSAHLAGSLIPSAEATELFPWEGHGCFDEAEPARPAEQRVYTGEKISLDLKDADVVNVLRMLSEVGGENIVITGDVTGRITLRLVDVPWDQALDIVLQANRLQCVEIGNVWRVSAISRLQERREAELAAGRAAGGRRA